MEESSRTVLQDFQLASRKAEESALRRYQASAWLESFIGPLPLPIRLSSQPSELEFVSRLRNGLVLCNLMNKIEPGIVPKVIDISENQPLPAYQYFENVRNFLVAVEGLNLPAFEASDLGKDSVNAGSTEKIVDCILSLKSYHEWKQWSDGSAGSGLSGSAKHLRSPMVLQSTGRSQTRFGNANSGGACRHLDMAIANDKTPSKEGDSGKLEDSVIEALVESLLDSKENIDHNLLASFRSGSKDSLQIIAKIMSSCLQSQQTDTLPEVKSILHDPLIQESSSTPVLPETSLNQKLSGERRTRDRSPLRSRTRRTQMSPIPRRRSPTSRHSLPTRSSRSPRRRLSTRRRHTSPTSTEKSLTPRGRSPTRRSTPPTRYTRVRHHDSRRRSPLARGRSPEKSRRNVCRYCKGVDHRVFDCPDLVPEVTKTIKAADGAFLSVSNFPRNMDLTCQVDDLFFYFSKVGVVRSIWIYAGDSMIVLRYVWRDDAERLFEVCKTNLYKRQKLRVEWYTPRT